MTSVVTRHFASVAVVAAMLAANGAVGQEPSVVRVLVPENGDRTGEVFAAAVTAFESAYPDIAVEVELVGWDVLSQALTSALSEGTPPDLAIIGTAWLGDLVANGDLAPLDDRMTDAFRSGFIPGLLPASRIDGRTWGLPAAASARALYYNADLLARAGLSGPPETWDTLEEAAVAVAALGDDVYGFGIQGAAIETDLYFYYALWAQGAALIEADGSSGLDSPGAIHAAELYARLIENGAAQPDVTAHNREDLQDLFAAGRLAMMISSPFLASRLADDAVDFDWAVAPIPTAAVRATYGVTDSLVMFADSPVKDDAWRFVEHIFKPEWRRMLVAGEDFLPTTTVVAESAMIAEDPVASVFTDALSYARFLPSVAHWNEIADITSNALRRIYDGAVAPEGELTAVAGEIDALLGVARNAE